MRFLLMCEQEKKQAPSLQVWRKNQGKALLQAEGRSLHYVHIPNGGAMMASVGCAYFQVNGMLV